MVRVLCLVVLISFLVQGAPGAETRKYVPKKDDFTVVCTLFNGKPPDIKEGPPYIPITYDPNIILGARIEGVTFGSSPWQPGTSVQFLVHSPALLLGKYAYSSGHRFALTFSHFHPTTKEDHILFKPDTQYTLQWIEKVND